MSFTVARVALVILLALLAAALLFLDKAVGIRKESREPIYIPARLPQFGHLLGLMRYKMRYYALLAYQCKLPIFSLAMPAGRAYVVTDPNIVAETQKLPKSFSLGPMRAKFTAQLAGLSPPAAEKPNNTAEGNLLDEGLEMMREVVRPGIHLKEMSKVVATSLIRELEKPPAQPQPLDLWEWVRRTITLAATDAAYGPRNPFQDPAREQDFWAFAGDTIPLLVGIWPSFFARKGYKGRENLARAFEHYFQGDISESSYLTRRRHEILSKHDISISDQARFECVNGIAILANSAPAAFWVLWNVLSRPDLHAQVRAEASKLVVPRKASGTSKPPTYTLRPSQLLDSPFLVSLMRESIRHYGAGANSRLVLQDTHLAGGSYLLKKDAVVMIPARVMHFDSSVWGPQAHAFDAERFARPDAKAIHAAAFRGFGGGTTLCPGRHFAMTEILIFTVLVALMFDAEPTAGTWVVPAADESNMSIAIASPCGKVSVRLKPREEWKGVEWEVVA